MIAWTDRLPLSIRLYCLFAVRSFLQSWWQRRKGHNAIACSLSPSFVLLDQPGDMKLKMCAGKQHDPRTVVLPAQDFRGSRISGGKAAQSCCCLYGLLSAAPHHLSSFYKCISWSCFLVIWNVVGMARSLAVPCSSARGRTAGGVCVVVWLARG